MDPQLLSFILIGAAFYFLLIRPQQVRTRKHKELIAGLSVGDHVVTIGGLHGTVAGFGQDTVLLRAGGDVELEFSKGAIASVKPPVEEPIDAEGAEPVEEAPLSDD